MSQYDWELTFNELYERSLQRYLGGDRTLSNYYTDDDLTFLASIGCQQREFFDYVEDYGDGNDPSPSAALMIASTRRDYFRVIQNSQPSENRVVPSDLPGKGEELDGIRWLPRIIAKAEGKLRGELDEDIMFCCGGDRAFLRTHDIHPAEFLREVWGARGDASRVIEFVKNH